MKTAEIILNLHIKTAQIRIRQAERIIHMQQNRTKYYSKRLNKIRQKKEKMEKEQCGPI